MAHLGNLHNQYAAELEELFDLIPKAVLAAIAVSALTNGGDHIQHAKSRIAKEWLILHQNGIVPQKPSKAVLNAINSEDDYAS